MSMAPQQNRGGFQGGGRPQGGGNRPNNPPLPAFDVGHIKFGKNIDDKLFDSTAQAIAKAIAEEGGGRKNKSTQLRKFYDELMMWHDKVFEHGVDRETRYKELAPFIKMLCAKVTYAKGREHVSPGFETLFTHVIRAIYDPDTLKQAKLFIEAFMGFYKAEER